MANKNAVRTITGAATVTGLAIIWTSAQGGNNNPVFGEYFYDPAKGAKTRFSDDDNISELTLSTVWSSEYAKLYSAFYTAKRGNSDLVAVATINEATYTFSGCSIAGGDSFPGFDMSGGNTTPKTLTLVLAPTKRSELIS